MQTKVSIVVTVLNGEEILPASLDSLMSLEYSKDNLEIIVVDNNSTDNSRNIIKQYPVRYVFEPKRGRAVALNRGIKESQYEFIAFIDSDCTADKYWLKNIIEGFTKEYIGGCGGRILPYQPKTYAERVEEIRSFYFQEGGLFSKAFLLPAIVTGNAAYRRNVLIEAGLFDDSFSFIQEDVELSWRVCLKGYQLRYIPEAIVYNKYRDNIPALFDKSFQIGCSNIYLYKKYKKISKKLCPYHFIRWVKLPFVIFKNLFAFILSLCREKNKFKNFFPLLKIIDELATSLGEVYGFVILGHSKEKIASIPVPKNKVFWRKTGDEIIITHLDKEFDYILSDVGAQIWELLKDERNTPEIVNTIVNKYEISAEQARKDLICLVDELKSEGLL